LHLLVYLLELILTLPTPVVGGLMCGAAAARLWDCGFESRRSIIVCLLCVLCVCLYIGVIYWYRGALPSVVCLSVLMKLDSEKTLALYGLLS
jgi:hypothetical protein